MTVLALPQTAQPTNLWNSCNASIHPNSLSSVPPTEQVSGAYAAALNAANTPVIALSRQGLPHPSGSSVEGVRGVRCEPCTWWRCIRNFACHRIRGELVHQGARERINDPVVSFPCWELFESQPDEYKRRCFLLAFPSCLSRLGRAKVVQVLAWTCGH